MITVSICVSDIPKELIKKNDNGKSYMNIVIAPRKEADKFGNTHSVYMSQSKEDREAKKEKIYIGNAKEIVFKDASNQKTNTEQNFINSDPF